MFFPVLYHGVCIALTAFRREVIKWLVSLSTPAVECGRTVHCRWLQYTLGQHCTEQWIPYYTVLFNSVLNISVHYSAQQCSSVLGYSVHISTAILRTVNYLEPSRDTSLIVLCCTVNCCTVQYSTVLYCRLVHCTALYNLILHCKKLCCTLYTCTVIYTTVLHCKLLHCTLNKPAAQTAGADPPPLKLHQ